MGGGRGTKRTPVEIRVGTRPTPTRVAAVPRGNNGGKRMRRRKRGESLNALLILSACGCVCVCRCVGVCRRGWGCVCVFAYLGVCVCVGYAF